MLECVQEAVWSSRRPQRRQRAKHMSCKLLPDALQQC